MATTKVQTAERIYTVVGRKMRGRGGAYAKAEAWRVEVRAATEAQAHEKGRMIQNRPGRRFCTEIIGSRPVPPTVPPLYTVTRGDGSKVKVTVPPNPCPVCDGSGRAECPACGGSGDDYPATVEVDGREYVKTGKHGRAIEGGVAMAEYEAADASRVWADAYGRVVPE